MRIGKSVVPVYWSEKERCLVIKLGSAGTNFGHVQDIETRNDFGTYGYSTLPKVGTLEIEVSAGIFKPE